MTEHMHSAPNIDQKTNAEARRYCATCGHHNPAETDTCLHCGAALATNCPVCGQVVPAGNKFCSHCGAALPETRAPGAGESRAAEVRQNLRALMPTALAQKISASAGEIMGEHREVTVLFLNVINSTVTPYPLDNEDSYHLMNEALQLLVEVIYKYDGIIDKLTGDGLVALFGAPVSHENDPERAARAALELQTIIQPWRARARQAQGFDFQLRIGINTGPVIAGKVGNDLHMNYTVIGDTVNLAYHLQMASEPGMILVSGETYQRIRSLFDFKALPHLAITWLNQPLQAFQLLSLRLKPVREYTPRLRAPLIGRSHDLAQLHQALAAVQAHGQSRVVFVSGEAGLGKSRLVAEFRHLLDPASVRVYQGHCLTYARQNPLGVVAEMVRHIVHLAETEADEVQLQALQHYLDQLDLPHPNILPYLAHVLELTAQESPHELHLRRLDPAMLQRQTHAALRQFFLAEARSGPLVLIFEDLHWVEPASRDFLKYLIQTTAGAPLLLILVARQVEHDPMLHPLLTATDPEPERRVNLQLQTLSATEAKLLADQLIPQITGEAQLLKEQMVYRAEGNPLFLEEIIQHFIDRGGLVRHPAEGAWQFTWQANELFKTVPDTIKGLILARFDRLPETLRRTLQKAAILGGSFPTSLLEQVVDLSPEALAGQLVHLEAWWFLNPAPFRAQPGFTFRHALLQETIYATLLKRDRSKIHTSVAEAIERSTLWLLEEQAEILAYHYTESTSPARAIPYLMTAAERAARRCANEVAVKHYRQALALLPPQPDLMALRLRLGLGDALKFIGEFGTARQILAEALHYLEQEQPAADEAILKPLRVEALRLLADVRQREGVYEEALAYLEVGLQILGTENTPSELVLQRALLDRMAWIRFRQGQLEEAYTVASQATAGIDPAQADDPIRLASLYNTLGGVAWQQGRLAEAITHTQRSLDLYENLGYLWGTAVAYGNLGILYDVQGNWPAAADQHERAYLIHQMIGNSEGQATCLDNLGILHTFSGKYDTAQRELESGLAIRQQLGDIWGMAQSQVNLALLALNQSRFEQAASLAQTALSLAANLSSFEIQIPAWWCLALVHAEQGDAAAGLKLAQQALELAQSSQFIEGQIDALRALGIVYSRAGDNAQAESCLRASIELCQKHGARYRQGQALYELGRFCQQMSEADPSAASEWQAQAVTHLQQALDLFQDLGAAQYLAATRQALG